MNQNKLKIVILHSGNDPYTDERIKFLLSKGHDITLICYKLSPTFPFKNTVRVIPLKLTLLDNIPFLKRLIHFFQIKKIVKTINPDIYHVVSALNLFYLSFDTPFVKIIENQGSDLILTPNHFPPLKLFYKCLFPKVDCVIQDSHLLQQKSFKYGANRNPEFNKVFNIGVDFTFFNRTVPKGKFRQQYNLQNKIIILHTRGNRDIYNLETLIKSLKIVREQVPDILYVLTTEFDSIKKHIKNYIIKYNLLNNILFLGYVHRFEQLPFIYRDADINISVPSSDSSPFSVYESMACLTKNIVTDLPWLYSKFTPHKHLETVPVGNSAILAESIINLINGNNGIDTEDAYRIVNNEINLQTENQKLLTYYNFLQLHKQSHYISKVSNKPSY